MTKTEITYKRLTEIHEYGKNPRRNAKAVETVANSIKEFGFKNPVIVNLSDNEIICGHVRYKAAKRLGLETVPCIMVNDLTEEQIKAFRIADNSTSDLAEWDFELLTAEIMSLPEFDFASLGLSLPETEKIIIEDNYNISETLPRRTNPGGIWVLGRHRLMCGDSTKPEDAAKLMDGQAADLMLTDPPYNVNYGDCAKNKEDAGYKTARVSSSIANDNMRDKAFFDFLSSFYRTAYGVMKDGAALYVFHSSKETVNFMTALRQAKFKYSQTLIWFKNHFVLGRQDYQWIHEPILYGWKEKEGCPHYFIDDRTQSTLWIQDKPDFEKMKKSELISFLEKICSDTQSTVLEYDKPLRSPEHPTMKPIALCGRLILNSSRADDIVYDPFGGSGSTLIACEQTGRKCCTMELDPHYCDIIIERWEKYAGEKAERLS